MSASQPRAHDLRRGDSLLSARAKEAGRALLSPIVRLAVALHLTPNTITVIGFLVVVGASVLVAAGNLLAGALMLEQNDEWAVSRRTMSLESLAVLSDAPRVSLPGVAA